MSSQDQTPPTKDYRLDPKATAWQRAWQVPAVLALVGLLASMLAWSSDPARFGYSYLFGLTTVLTFVFGALFLVIIQHFTAGHWGVSTRRIVEVVMSGAPIAALLAIPFLVGVATGSFHLYDEWMGGHGGHEEHGEEHADEDEHASLFAPSVAFAQEAHDAEHSADHDEGHAHTPQMEALHHHIIEHKSPYLNLPGWLGRALFYLFSWVGIALFFWTNSRKQDATRNIQLTARMKAFTPIASILFGLTLTFAAFDWLMALEPSWYSTIFGVVIFAGSTVAILGFTTVVGISFHTRGIVGNAINVEHIHDLGKLLFGFMCFWTYVSFSQWMLIWYAGIPEEATWFHKRWDGGWNVWSVALALGHFVFPFFFLISRIVKRNFGLMMFGAAWLIGMHVADIYWYVLPQAGELRVSIGDFGALLFCGGVFFTYVFYTFTRVPLIPVGDPRLARSLHHHQSH